jgi:hypothetical protein
MSAVFVSYVAWGGRGTNEHINSGESNDEDSDSSDLHMFQGTVDNDEGFSMFTYTHNCTTRTPT